MSTTPQRYDYGDRIEDPMKECDDGPYILFTDHEADKARAVEKVRRSFEVQQRNYILLYEAVMGDGSITSELINPEDVARRLRSTIATQQATIARLKKAVERASELLEAVRIGEDFEVVCWEAAEKFKQMLKNPSP